MLDLIAELGTSSHLLEVAIDRYLAACSAIRAYYSQSSTFTEIPRALSDCVAGESLSVSCYEINVKRASSIISQAQNCNPRLTPIHTLPPEVLTRIFQLVIDTSCNIDIETSEATSPPKYPARLSQVCSHWRIITINAPSLWTHIDLTHFHSSTQKFVNHAKTCVTRAGDAFLDIHIRVPAPHDSSDEQVLLSFLSSVAARSRSVELAIPRTIDDFDDILFESIFRAFKPGTLAQLTITDHGPYTPDFFITSDGDEDEDADIAPQGLYLMMEKDVFEKLMFPVSVLRLDGLYPRWTSQAYRGLTELRLDQPIGENFPITNLQLYTILTSSPELVVLHFGLRITTDDLGRSETPAVQLEHLEELNLSLIQKNSQLELFFRLLAPVSNPLHLTIELDPFTPLSPDSKSGIIGFLKHSNITRLHFNGAGQELQLEELLLLLPRLRVLSVNGFRNRNLLGLPAENGAAPTSFRLDAIYILSCRFELGYICPMIKRYPVEAMILWGSDLYRADKYLDDDTAKAELCATLGHTVKIVEFKKEAPRMG